MSDICAGLSGIEKPNKAKKARAERRARWRWQQKLGLSLVADQPTDSEQTHRQNKQFNLHSRISNAVAATCARATVESAEQAESGDAGRPLAAATFERGPPGRGSGGAAGYGQ